MEVALDPPPGGVGGLDDPHARRAQLLRPGVLDLLDAQRLLRPAALGHVEERAVDPRAAGAARDVAAVEDPAHLAVGADDPVLEGEGALVLRRLLDDVLDPLEVVRVHDAQQRAPRARDERRRRVAGDPLDLVADELDDVPGVPGGPVDGARHVEQERADERVVGAVAGRGETGPGAREELAATERPLEVVVGTRRQGVVRTPRDRQQPGVLRAAVPAYRPAHGGDVAAAALGVDHDELDRAATVRRRQGGIDVGAREHGVTGCAQPRLHLRLDRADDEHRGGSPPD